MAGRSGRRARSGAGGGSGGSTADLTAPTDLTARAAPQALADPQALARAIALRQLTMAPRTRAQLAQAMARRGVPEEVADGVLDRFTEVRLVDDEEFAAQWVSSRHLGRGLARRALAHELRHRGVAEDTVREAVEVIDDEAELAAARELVRRRLPGMATLEPGARARRLAGMLARKGYGGATAGRALRAELDEAAEAAEAAEGSWALDE